MSVVPLKAPRKAARIVSVALAAFLPIVFVVVRRAPLPAYEGEWIVALFFAALLYLILHQTERAKPGLYRRISGFFSRISYTLYLVHLPLAVLLCACINNPWHLWPKSSENLAVFLLFNAVLVIISHLVYLAFEANTDKVRQALFPRTGKPEFLRTAAT